MVTSASLKKMILARIQNNSFLLYSLATGIILSISLLNHLEWFIFFAFMPIFYYWLKNSHTSIKNYFMTGFFAQFIFTFYGFYWIRFAIENYFLTHSIIAHLFLILFCCILSLPWGFVGILFYLILKKSKTKNLFYWICLPFIMTIFDEFIFKFIPFHFGFHIYSLKLPIIDLAKYVGLAFIGFLVYQINYFSTCFIIYKNKKSLIPLVTLLILFFIPFSTFNEKIDPTHSISVLGIQGHISNQLKRSALQTSQDQIFNIDTYFQLTKKALSSVNKFPDLVVWPETAIPIAWNKDVQTSLINSLYAHALQTDIENFVTKTNVSLLSGGYLKLNGLYNSSLLFKPQYGLNQFSFKYFLFPIGEYIPFEDFWGLTHNYFPEVPRFLQNQKPQVLTLNSQTTILTPICYEGIFESYYFDYLKQSSFVISLTNDSWFNSDLQKKWHALMTLAHSTEFNRPFVRITNDGLSGVAYPNGDYQFMPEQNYHHYFEVPIKKINTESFYQKFGDFLSRIPRTLAYFFILILLI